MATTEPAGQLNRPLPEVAGAGPRDGVVEGGPAATPVVRWHPPAAVLQAAELAVAGLPMPAPAGLAGVDPAAVPASATGLELEDAEGTPVAVLAADGTVRPMRPFGHGPLRHLRRPPGERLVGAGPDPLGVLVTAPPSEGDVERARDEARRLGVPLVWLALTGAGRDGPLPPQALLRALRRVAEEDPESARSLAAPVVPLVVPLLVDPERDREWVAAAAGLHPLAGLLELPPADDVPPHPAFAEELALADRPPHRRGVTVFFTGLSGSGKSTLAKALVERLEAETRRAVTTLDGDEVRRLLSHGLGFGRADRALNIRRIAFVAAEVARHGGLAVCAPIAPFAAGRAEARAMVAEHGDFVLVHVATPLAECERRDRKGLYARARRGEIPDFTGISSPYEQPTDAELTVDTTGRGVAEALEPVWQLLCRRGYLGPPPGPGAPA